MKFKKVGTYYCMGISWVKRVPSILGGRKIQIFCISRKFQVGGAQNYSLYPKEN